MNLLRLSRASVPIVSALLLASPTVTHVAAQNTASAFEGVITMRLANRGGNVTTMQEMEYMARGGKVRMSIAGPMGSMAIIGVPAEQKMYVLIDQQSAYMEMRMDAEGARAVGAVAAMPEPKMTRTGRKETIAGYECEHVLVESSQQTYDVCMARGLGPFVNAMSSINRMGRGGASLPAWQRSLGAEGAFPLKVTGPDGAVQLEVTRIERKKLAEAQFAVPLNYTKMDMPRRP